MGFFLFGWFWFFFRRIAYLNFIPISSISRTWKKGWWKLWPLFRTSWDSLVSFPLLPPGSGASHSQMQFQLPTLCWWFLDCLLSLDTYFSVQIVLSLISTCRCLTLCWNALWLKQSLVFIPTHPFFSYRSDHSFSLDSPVLSWCCTISRIMPCL